MPQAYQRFTKEFQDETVRLALTGGLSPREVAGDLGVGLSTLRHWIDRRRERETDHPPEERQEDMVTELKRLGRENEILRQEREPPIVTMPSRLLLTWSSRTLRPSA
jgi:transposase